MAHRDMTNGSVGMSGLKYDAFVSRQRNYHDTDWAAKLQEKYWGARQKFLAKVERKEDSCIVLSDSKLDAKLEIYRSIDKSCARLTTVLENYQNSLFVFANEENALGILLKECGKHDRTKAGKIMTITGKSLTQSSHQRIRLYMPLLRLFQEMETFHSRAVEDTSDTVDKLESKRSQYRASLLWMKDISEKLDPDIYRQLDKFRRVQAKVRDDKKLFDGLQMDVVQKIDLLMASRCNLMNQILAPYQSILLKTFEKNCSTFRSVEEMIKQEDIYEYEFKTLKQLNPLRLSTDDDTPEKSTEEQAQQQQPKEGDLLIYEEPKSLDDDNNNKSNVRLISDELTDALVDVSLDSDGAFGTMLDKNLNGSTVEDSADTLELLEKLFGKKQFATSEKDSSQVKSEQVNGDEICHLDELKAMRTNLEANLFDICDDEQQIANLLGLSESSVVKTSANSKNTNDNVSHADRKDSAFHFFGGDLVSQWNNGDNVELDPIQSSKPSTSKDCNNHSYDINLLGELEQQQNKSVAGINPRQPTIDDLLSKELDDIDNSSYFKSLQGLQI